MAGPRPAAAPPGVELLERALGYTRGVLARVVPADLERPTPCSAWTLGTLLAHMDDSLRALSDAARDGRVGRGAPEPPDTDPLTSLRDQACTLLGGWLREAPAEAAVSVDGRPLTSFLVTATGALEVAVHGWDVARTCGFPGGLPEGLARDLLPLAHLVVTDEDRPGRFAPAVAVPAQAPRSARLLAFLGRVP